MHHQIKVPSNYTEYVSLGKGIAKVVDHVLDVNSDVTSKTSDTSGANRKYPVIPSKVSAIILTSMFVVYIPYLHRPF